MKYKILLATLLFTASVAAQAEWFLRGSYNNWGATSMSDAGIANTVVVKNVMFATAGHIKFDRYGDWYESYGVGGIYGSNIPVAAGAWTISFNTNTKTWQITETQYHLRANAMQWAEGFLLTKVGNTSTYEYCHNHNLGFGTGGFQFKVDPNGGWGGDDVPASNYVITTPGWVKISFNATTKAITTQHNMSPNCGDQYHLRSNYNQWAEGTLLTRVGTSNIYEHCHNHNAGFGAGGFQFKVDPNGGWGGDDVPASNYVVTTPGWVKISFNATTKNITTQQNMSENCL